MDERERVCSCVYALVSTMRVPAKCHGGPCCSAFLPNEDLLNDEKVLQNKDFIDLRSECEDVRCWDSILGGGREGGSLTTLGDGEGAVKDALLAVRDDVEGGYLSSPSMTAVSSQDWKLFVR